MSSSLPIITADDVRSAMSGSMRQVAFYGKGGIGKSTTVANVSSAQNEAGLKVLQVGCDPKHDSSRPFWDGPGPASVIDLLRDYGGSTPELDEFLCHSDKGVDYIEAGGPEPGVGCAGRGILKMFEILDEYEVLGQDYDVVTYDVLGDVVCGGFAAPLRAGYARNIYIVISGEFMALYAANNICKGILKYAERRDTRLGGLVLNCRNVPNELKLAEEFAESLGTRIAAVIPRDNIVSEAEKVKKTVVEAFPDSTQAAVYRSLAETIVKAEHLVIPKPLTEEELEVLYREALS